MRLKSALFLMTCIFLGSFLSYLGMGCAQIGAPTGGTKDTLAPRLMKAIPTENKVQFKGNKIVFTFDEYIDLQEVQSNVLVSPLTKFNPQIDAKLKTVTVKFKDSLLPNTTYSINFGDAIKDVNEGNPFKNFTYVFSTGNYIDSFGLKGKIVMAETGLPDSSMVAMLYKNLADSAVKKLKPDYIARLKGDGSFAFRNLPAGQFNLFALKDGDGSKNYNNKEEVFAFNNQSININSNNAAVSLFAFSEIKPTVKAPLIANTEKKLKYSTPIINGRQDLLSNLQLSFNKSLKIFDTSKIILTDTNHNRLATVLTIDSTRKIVSLATNWKEDSYYLLIIPKEAVADSNNTPLAKTDSLLFGTKRESDYGNVIFRFSNIDFAKKPVLQFVSGEEITNSYPLTTLEWSSKLFIPGEYEIRILLDDNGNGKWDGGNYDKKRQPEKVIPIKQKISIRPNFDNEKEISL